MNNPFTEAVNLLISGNEEVIFIFFTSFKFSFVSVFLASIFSIPFSIFLKLNNFRFKKSIVAFLHGLMALPTVVIGLMVYSLISNSGLFGSSRILYTPLAIIIGQSILAFPLISSMVYSGLNKLDPRFQETLITLGAGKSDIFTAVVKESKFIILYAVLAGFGRVLGEVGISMMLGGNIRWFTRTITTTIVLESSKGSFSLALALGFILMVIALSINFVLHLLVKDE